LLNLGHVPGPVSIEASGGQESFQSVYCATELFGNLPNRADSWNLMSLVGVKYQGTDCLIMYKILLNIQ